MSDTNDPYPHARAALMGRVSFVLITTGGFPSPDAVLATEMHDGVGYKNSMHNVHVLLIDAGEGLLPQQTVNAEQMEQFRFTQRPTLSEGLNVLQQLRFHLVLVNLSLPDASVAESVTKIIALAPDLPVIALVNEGDTPKAAEALQLGTDDYLSKGCRRDYLTQMMRHAIERKRLFPDRRLADRRMATTDKQLTAHLSHEVRNALACIHQFGTIMIDGLAGSVTNEQREFLCIMIENASKIRTVLDDALEHASAPGIH